MLKRWIAAAAMTLVAGIAHAQQQTEVVLQFPYPELFTETHKRIAEEFAKVHPEIKVTFRAPYESYEEATQKVLREAVTSRMVSDVPLGAFLSGGLDSSAVVALMRQATSGTIRTCSMVFTSVPLASSICVIVPTPVMSEFFGK